MITQYAVRVILIYFIYISIQTIIKWNISIYKKSYKNRVYDSRGNWILNKFYLLQLKDVNFSLLYGTSELGFCNWL